ncbi:MAG TPA: ATP-binding protein, partial [Amaricoccus sp.]|nr:ATP-binding protein [Amaricoccus sp.]
MLKQAEARDAELRQARRYEPAARRSPTRAEPSIGSELARAAVKQLNTRQGQALVRGILGTLFRSR